MPIRIAIVGRPNVGKSTLFNRLVGRRLALVDDQPGITRDRREGEGRLYDLAFSVIDTAGLEDASDESLVARMRRQTEIAIAEANVVLFLIDARAGLTPLDLHFAELLRRSAASVVVIANKCEGRAGEAGVIEAFNLGLGEPVALSAEHGLGLSDLHEALTAVLGNANDQETADIARSVLDAEDTESEPEVLQLAIVGRPNVGKSTLINRLLGEERLLTGPESGITRDSIAIEWRHMDRPIRLVDTAGLRRKARVSEKIEKLSVADTLRSVRFAHVVILLIDANQGLEKQDLAIASHVVEEGRALVIGVNKWDAAPDRQAVLRQVRDRLQRSLPQVRGLPVVTISALQNRGLDRLLNSALEAYDLWNRRLPTAELNRWLAEAQAAHPPPIVDGRRLRLKYVTQPKARPPTFAIFCSRSQLLPDTYVRYLENALREDFDLPGTPIRIVLRKGRNPYGG